MNLFSITDENQKREAKEKLGIPNRQPVLSYLGSIGTWYMLDEMLLFFKQLKAKYPGSVFLFITHSSPDQILSLATKYGLGKEDLIIKELSRKEVPIYMKASDVNISFIKPVFSKISSSPTKLGEVLSMGIPVICNSGIGDVKEIVEASASGVVIDSFSEADFEMAIEKIAYLTTLNPLTIRTAAAKVFDLNNGIELYKLAYQQIL
jgi:glycosyltransferase involved in cell wall biosynthesis